MSTYSLLTGVLLIALRVVGEKRRADTGDALSNNDCMRTSFGDWNVCCLKGYLSRWGLGLIIYLEQGFACEGNSWYSA